MNEPNNGLRANIKKIRPAAMIFGISFVPPVDEEYDLLLTGEIFRANKAVTTVRS